MSGVKDGGPAFPKALDPYPNLQDKRRAEDAGRAGMTLRDYFAAAALPFATVRYESITGSQIEKMFGPRATNINRERIVAKLAYDLADAMIASRSGEG